MATGKRFILPSIVIVGLVLVLLLIGWLAFSFFDALARKAAPAEPYFAITTAAVQRARMRIPETRDHITLAEEARPDAIPVRAPIAVPPDDGATPAACIHYGETITSRPAWHNPIEYSAVLSPNRVRVTVIPPPTVEEEP